MDTPIIVLITFTSLAVVLFLIYLIFIAWNRRLIKEWVFSGHVPADDKAVYNKSLIVDQKLYGKKEMKTLRKLILKKNFLNAKLDVKIAVIQNRANAEIAALDAQLKKVPEAQKQGIMTKIEKIKLAATNKINNIKLTKGKVSDRYISLINPIVKKVNDKAPIIVVRNEQNVNNLSNIMNEKNKK